MADSLWKFPVSVRKSSVSADRNARYGLRPEVSAGRGQSASRIAFDCGIKAISVAQEIEEAEAAELIGLIQLRCRIVPTPTRHEAGIRFWP